MYGEREAQDEQDFTIAQALLATNIPTTQLLDIIYDYANYGSYQRGQLYYFSDDMTKLEGVRFLNGKTLSNLCKTFNREFYNLFNQPFFDPGIKIHILPQEIAFDASMLCKAWSVVFDKDNRSNQMLIVSLCKRYALDCSYQMVIASPISPKLSESSGWQRAIKMLTANN